MEKEIRYAYGHVITLLPSAVVVQLSRYSLLSALYGGFTR